MSHVFYQTLEKRANLVNMFKQQQAARSASKKMRLHDALGSVVSRMKKKRNDPVAMFKQQQAARAARQRVRMR